MNQCAAIPQFHLYGDPADDQVFDFIHIESIPSRARQHGWVIAPHSHRHLSQILFITGGGGEMDIEDETRAFPAPALLFVRSTAVHGFRFLPEQTDGYVISFTEDVVRGVRDATSSLRDRFNAAAARIVAPFKGADDLMRLHELCGLLQEEHQLGRDGHHLAMRAYLALILVEAGRLIVSRNRNNAVTLRRADQTVDRLRDLVQGRFRTCRRLSDYASELGMTVDRLNEHCKRVTGVTAGHLIRQRVVTEAKRQLMFTDIPVSQIAFDLAFADPSHFTRFFRRYTGTTPQLFRAGLQRRPPDPDGQRSECVI
jgi:AraC family transcriptional regulator, transcriptional activator of pobA